ncbi:MULTISPECIES: hypothetical protein [Pseudomonas]|uniref:hypothetical protein n=1 Tax=Pseudomonas TaxID=286 RepID=UPI0018AA7DAB|nr:hypothetical protein [Pseudomonas guariconensis]MBF8723964.1 hypothetical protein [Pseudomonas guariconensis]MBF8742988.1 hypothetical protein [Pseudomonas guariconensis]MBF8752429.1 hypothetical protein [Pseudomonas guariconensis]MBF8795139.1 hypothetical protein [Pseudomonas monteilii]
MKRLAVLALATTMIYGCSDEGPWEGPAGTKMGLKREQIERHAILQKVGTNNVGALVYTSKQAPKLDAQADGYNYVFSKDDELCLVQMRFDRSNRSSEALMDELKARYGMPDQDDRVARGVVWSSRAFKLSDDLAEISSEFTGREPRAALVSFWFANFDTCKATE